MSYQTEQLRSDIESYEKTIAGSWLGDFNWKSITIRLVNFGIENIFQAAYFAISNRIYCVEDKNDGVFFSSIIHELFHAYQRERMGLSSYLIAKAFSRKEIENSAKSAEIEAALWYGNNRIEQWQGNKK